VTPHPAIVHRCLMRRCASYQAYSLHPNGRPDKAVTPHPAIVHRCLMRRYASYQAYKPAPER
ncbi:hypothetical protein, partial [Escherichia marmotae]|uniref:hypothetical protein n=1 Tax=Escherichia marmotae TaxID=1499973 RepID=UPI002000BC68